MPATNQQVQRFVDERFRPFAEAMRSLYIKSKDHKSAIDDVYAAVAAQSPTWTDQRLDGPPTLLTPAHVLEWNAFLDNVITFIEGNAHWQMVLDACVRAPEG